MTESAATLMAIIFGIAVFAVIVVIGWRSVQNRRILRMQGADGQETIIIAREDDDITNVVTTTTETAAPEHVPPADDVRTDAPDPESESGFGRKTPV
jgi:hypothetical protein